MPLLVLTATILGSILAVLSIFSQVELWQRKEYRWDRIHTHIHSPEFRTTGLWFLIVTLALSNIAWIIYLAGQSMLAETIGWSELVLMTIYHGQRIKTRGLFRPQFTVKASALLILITLVAALYIITLHKPLETFALQWATLVILIPYLTALCVAVVNIPARLRKQTVIRRATQYRRGLKNLKVIGITGSFGKTSTKHYLQQILQQAEVPVKATKQHRNEAYVIAGDVLEQLTPSDLLYVVEMGAYRAGEIATAAAIVQPQVGVITAIHNQHVALFGSREELATAKWELITALPPTGVAVLNADDPMIVTKVADFSGHVVWYSQEKTTATVHAKKTTFNATDTQTTLVIGKKSTKVTIPLAGEGHLQNVLAAIAVCHALELPATKLTKAITALTPYPRTMEIRSGQHGATIIDDSYSANEAGVLAAIKHLDRFPVGAKIIVLQPLIELGSEAPMVHERIGVALAKSGAQVFVSGKSFQRELQLGYGQPTNGSLEFISHPQELMVRLGQVITSQTVVLLEGRIPDPVHRTALASTADLG